MKESRLELNCLRTAQAIGFIRENRHDRPGPVSVPRITIGCKRMSLRLKKFQVVILPNGCRRHNL